MPRPGPLPKIPVVLDRGLEHLWSQHISDEEAATIVEVMERVLHTSHGDKT